MEPNGPFTVQSYTAWPYADIIKGDELPNTKPLKGLLCGVICTEEEYIHSSDVLPSSG